MALQEEMEVYLMVDSLVYLRTMVIMIYVVILKVIMEDAVGMVDELVAVA